MAQRTRVELIDDLDGTVLADGNGETVTFGLDGTAYEIDVSKKNAEKVRSAFQAYIAAGRRASPSARGRRTTSSATTTRDYDPKAVRKWAAANKVIVPARGRIPGEVLERYRAEGN